MTQNRQSSSQPRRRRELDAMGMLVVVGLVFFHSAQIFYYADFYVKNEPPNIQSVSQLVSTLLVAFAGLWGMPLLFLIAGLAIWYSLRKRTAGQFALERTRRLVVPLVVGTILLVPPMVYYGQKSDPAYQETYLQFLPRFFNVQSRSQSLPVGLRGTWLATPAQGGRAPPPLLLLRSTRIRRRAMPVLVLGS